MTTALRATREYVDILSNYIGPFRATREYVDILATISGKIRTTREYIEVLSSAPTSTEYDETVSHTLTLSQTVYAGQNYEETVAHTLTLNQTTIGEVNVEIVGHTLSLVQTITGNKVYSETISHTLHLVQILYAGQNYSETVEQTLSLAQGNNVGNMKRFFIRQHLKLKDNLIIAGPISEKVTSSLILHQMADSNVDYNCLVNHTLDLHSSFTYYIPSNPLLKQYHPFVGGGSTEHPSLILVGPMIGIVAPLQFIWPINNTKVTDYVTLRPPEFGNKDTLTFNRINRETRGGTLIIFANPIWPKIQTLALTFTGLRQIEVQDLFDFLLDHLGVEIGLIDWESRCWKGVLTTTTNPITEDSWNNYTVNLEFEGELILNWTPQILAVPSGLPCRTRI